MPSRLTTRRRLPRAGLRVALLAGAWLLGSAVAVGAALVLVPGATFPLLVVSVVASGAALLLVGGGVVVAVLAVAAAALGRTAGTPGRSAVSGRGRRRWVALVPVVLAVGAAVVGAAATALQVHEADRRGVDVAWSGYPGGSGAGAHGVVRAPASTEVYATVDGRELLADVWLPPDGAGSGARGRAAVVRVHGGSWSSGQRGAPAWDSALASAGAVVVEVDYRLTGALDGAPWRTQPRDVACAVAWVGANARRLGVDPARIVLMGDSAGAHLALLAAYAPQGFPPSCPLEPVRPAAVVALYPPTEMASLQRAGGWRYPDVLPGDGVLDLMGARPEDDPAAYRAASPLTHVGPDVPPTLVVHGDHDQVVPVEQSRALVAALRRAGAEHAYVELPLANHGFDQVWGAVTTQTARAAVLAWVDRV